MKCFQRMLCVCMAIVLLSFSGCSRQTKLVSFTPQHEGYINYNNYSDGMHYGHMDYCNGVLACENPGLFGLFNSITTVDATGQSKAIDGISAPFQLVGDGVVYMPDSALIYRDRDGKETVIEKKALHFTVYKSFVVYAVSKQVDRDLYIYDLMTGKTDVLLNDFGRYIIYKDCVYVTSRSLDISLYKISLDTREREFICQLEIDSFPYYLQISNDVLAICNADFHLLNLNTLQESILEIPGGLIYSNVSYICEENTIYYSYEGRIVDGSITYRDHEDEHNGTWKIDMTTGQRERISEACYSELYCFDKTHLYGYSSTDGITEIPLE